MCASGQGHALLYSFSTDKEFKLQGALAVVCRRKKLCSWLDSGSLDAHSAGIRELAVNLACPRTIASGGESHFSGGAHLNRSWFVGFDEKLCILDVGQGMRAVDSIALGAPVGSVKWPLHNQSMTVVRVCNGSFFSLEGVCVSCTLDTGQYQLFDVRTRLHKPVYHADFGKPVRSLARVLDPTTRLHVQELYTHERYSDYHLLLGFGDGEIKHLDMRSAQNMSGRVL